MGFIRRKEPVKRSKARSEARDPFVHLHEERAKLEEGEPWFLAGDDSADFQVQAGISSNLSADDLAAHEDAQQGRPSPDEAGPPTPFDGVSPELADPGQLANLGQVAEPALSPEAALPAELTLPAEPRREPRATDFDEFDQTTSEDFSAWQAEPTGQVDAAAPAARDTPTAPPTPPAGIFGDTGFMPPTPGFTPTDTEFSPPAPEFTPADETPPAPVESGFMPAMPEFTPADETPFTPTDTGHTPSEMETEPARMLPAERLGDSAPPADDASAADLPPPDAAVTAAFEPPASLFDRPAEPTFAEPATTDFLEPPQHPEASGPVDVRNLAAEASVIFGRPEPEVPEAGLPTPDPTEPSPGPAATAPAAPLPAPPPGEAPLERTLAASFRNLVAQPPPPPPPEVDDVAPAAAPPPEAGTAPAHPESPSDRVEPRRPRRPPRRPRGF